MAETTIAPGNKLQAYQRAPRREKPRMSAFLGESQAASDGGRWTKRQEGGPYKPGAVSLGTSHGTRSISPPTEVRAETGGIPGAVGRMGLPIEETAPEIIERYTGKPAYQYLQAGRKKGGKVRPGKRQGGGQLAPPQFSLSAENPDWMQRYRGEVSQPVGRGWSAFGQGVVEPDRGRVRPIEGRAGMRLNFVKGGKVRPGKRQYGGPIEPPRAAALRQPRSAPAGKRTMRLPGQYPKGLQFRAHGGLVKPGRHHMLVVMIGLKPKVDRLRKQGMISDKAHAKRRLP